MAIEAGKIKLHKAQREIHVSRSRFRVVAAGRRFGKSILAMATIVEEAAKYKKRKVWYVAPTYKMARQIMWEELKNFIPEQWLKRKPNETFMRFELINGSFIELKGADDADSLRGVGLHFVVLDEFQDMKPDVWKLALRPTLATTRGRALFIGTPKSYNALYDLWCNGQNDPTGVWKSWQFMTKDSPFVPMSEIEQAKKDMDEKSYLQEYEASFLSMSGKVYYGFDRATHVTDCPFNPKLHIYVGQDFNIDPMSSAVCQIQPNGEVWVVDEIVLYSSNTEEVCDEIERRYWRYKNQIIIYPDPAGGARQHARGETDLDVFRERGFNKIKYKKKHPLVSDRINCVNKMIKSADGKMMLKVDKKCRHTINGLEQCIYKEGSRDVDKSMGVEHIIDGLGYFINLEFPTRKIEIGGISI